MIVLYLKENNQFLQAIKGFPEVKEKDNKPISAGDLPHSEHIAKLKAVNASQAKPAIVTRRFMGQNYDVNCLVTQSVKELYQAGSIQVGDYVLVSFIEEIPDTVEKHIAIITDKVFKSW